MKEISAALVKAQKAFGPALKTSTNPAFRSKYAKLENCIEAVIDALNDNGIMLMQQTRACEDGVIVETTFIHESGEMLSGGVLHVPAAKHDPQGYGSALTYARRYSLQAACGIAPEDDDGNQATASVQQRQAAKPVAQAAKPEPKPQPKAAPAQMEGRDTEWQIKVSADPGFEVEEWIKLVHDAAKLAIGNAGSEADVMNIFKVNRNIFDRMKLESEESYKELMAVFGQAREKFKEQA